MKIEFGVGGMENLSKCFVCAPAEWKSIIGIESLLNSSISRHISHPQKRLAQKRGKNFLATEFRSILVRMILLLDRLCVRRK